MKAILPALFAILCGVCNAQTSADTANLPARADTHPPREDVQLWNDIRLTIGLKPKLDLLVMGTIQVGHNLSHPVGERAGVGLVFKVHPNITLNPYWLHASNQLSHKVSTHEERLVMNVTGRVQLGKFVFTDQNLIERRLRYASRDLTVYRNRLQIDYPLCIGRVAFRPFIADEVWYSTQSSTGRNLGWYRNRILFGVTCKFNDYLTGGVFYMHQNDGITRPGNLHTIGTLLRFNL